MSAQPQAADPQRLETAGFEPGAGDIVGRRCKLRWPIDLVRPGPRGDHGVQWDLPGAHVEPEEAPEQAALRELAEEVGRRAGLIGHLGTLGCPPPGRGRAIRMCSMHALRAVALLGGTDGSGVDEPPRRVRTRPSVAVGCSWPSPERLP